MGLDCLKDKRTKITVAHNIIIDDNSLSIKINTQGEYKVGSITFDVTLTCLSKGLIEADLADKIKSNLKQAVYEKNWEIITKVFIAVEDDKVAEFVHESEQVKMKAQIIKILKFIEKNQLNRSIHCEKMNPKSKCYDKDFPRLIKLGFN